MTDTDKTGSPEIEAKAMQPPKEEHCQWCNLWFYYGDYERHLENYHLKEQLAEAKERLLQFSLKNETLKKALQLAISNPPELKMILKMLKEDFREALKGGE